MDTSLSSEELLELAHTVATSALEAQGKVYSFYGPDHDNSGVPSGHDAKESTVPSDIPLTIPGDPTISFLLSGLRNNIVHVSGKINNVVIRKCHNTTVILEDGSISGVSVLYSHSMSVQLKQHTYTTIEFSTSILVYGDIENSSLIGIIGCQQVKLNDFVMPINEYTRLMLSCQSSRPLDCQMPQLSLIK